MLRCIVSSSVCEERDENNNTLRLSILYYTPLNYNCNNMADYRFKLRQWRKRREQQLLAQHGHRDGTNYTSVFNVFHVFRTTRRRRHETNERTCWEEYSFTLSGISHYRNAVFITTMSYIAKGMEFRYTCVLGSRKKRLKTLDII